MAAEAVSPGLWCTARGEQPTHTHTPKTGESLRKAIADPPSRLGFPCRISRPSQEMAGQPYKSTSRRSRERRPRPRPRPRHHPRPRPRPRPRAESIPSRPVPRSSSEGSRASPSRGSGDRAVSPATRSPALAGSPRARATPQPPTGGHRRASPGPATAWGRAGM